MNFRAIVNPASDKPMHDDGWNCLRERSLVLLFLLASTRAHALDECLAPIQRPSIQAVANAWQAGLRGEAHPEKKLPVATHPCVDLTALSAPKEVLVYGCSADKAFALVDVGGCRGPMPDDPIRCGGAVIDMHKGVFTSFIGAEGRPTGFRFFGNTLVKGWEGGLQLRFGKGLTSSKAVPKGRALDATADGVLLLALGGLGSERLAYLKPGSDAPTQVGPRVEEIISATPLAGTSLVMAQLQQAEGPELLLGVDLKSGQVVFNVKGLERYAVSPTGASLLTLVGETKPDGTNPILVFQFDKRGGPAQRLVSALPYGAPQLATQLQTGRAALAGNGVVELITVEPLERVAIVAPWGATEKIKVHTVRWMPDGVRLLAFAGEYVQATGKMRQVAALLNGATGKVLRTWPDTSAGSDATDLRLYQGDKVVLDITADGGTVAAAPLPAVEEDRSCETQAEGVTKELTVMTAVGVLVPLRR